MSDARMQCHICPKKELCPAETRVYINYCGSMYDELKERIRQARIDCRIPAQLSPRSRCCHGAGDYLCPPGSGSNTAFGLAWSCCPVPGAPALATRRFITTRVLQFLPVSGTMTTTKFRALRWPCICRLCNGQAPFECALFPYRQDLPWPSRYRPKYGRKSAR